VWSWPNHSFLRKDGSTNTHALLVNLTRTIKQTFTYVARHEKGIQHPLLTLKLGSGSCRDLDPFTTFHSAFLLECDRCRESHDAAAFSQLAGPTIVEAFKPS
jgi:hypothetical protein